MRSRRPIGGGRLRVIFGLTDLGETVHVEAGWRGSPGRLESRDCCRRGGERWVVAARSERLPQMDMIRGVGLVAVVGLIMTAPALGGDDPPMKGEVTKHTFAASTIFPGTTRDYWIYVPAQYDAKQPACVYVNQDGIQYNAPEVFDRLIARGEMPVTIGVFVQPGRVPALDGETALDRFNRSFEYDGLGEGYARFVLEELLPDVETKTTADGRAIRLSKNGNDRAIGGASSGAICAFTAAWERPEEFRRVFSAIGTYVGLRGGNEYPTLIRKYEPKAIRIFLEDGENDLNIYGGDWWMANQEMERALRFAGYEVEHAWGTGGHDGKHATEIFPDAMRFLWKGWPEPVKAGKGSPQLQEILTPDKEWHVVGEGYRFTEGPAVDARGVVMFNDVGAGRTYRIGLDGQVAAAFADDRRPDGQAFGPDGRLHAALGGVPEIAAFSEGKPAEMVASGFPGNDLVLRHDGLMYVTSPDPSGMRTSQVWLVRPDGSKQVVDQGLGFANGITVSPDQSLLYVADTRSHWVYSYQIHPDGTLAHKQKYYRLHSPDTADDAGADGLEVDRDGRLYVATRMGVQVCDQAGRVNAIIPLPGGARSSNLTMGGKDFDILYVTAGDKVFSRKLRVRGAPSFLPAVKPAAPRL